MKASTAWFRLILGLGFWPAVLVSCAPVPQVRQPGIVLHPITPASTQSKPTPTSSAPTAPVLISAKPQAKENPPKTLALSHPQHPNQASTYSQIRYAIPARYVATKGEGRTQGGQFDYVDESGKQLTDGILGGNDVLADLGRGRATEWVAWGLAQPKLEFSFATAVQLQRVQIRFNRNDRSFIGLPAKVVINGKIFVVNPKKLPDRTSGYLSFEGPFVGRSIKLEMTRGRGWVFVDEARFIRH